MKRNSKSGRVVSGNEGGRAASGNEEGIWRRDLLEDPWTVLGLHVSLENRNFYWL